MKNLRLATLILFPTLALVAGMANRLAASGPSGMVTGFEPMGSPSEVTNPNGYVTGSVLFQDGWIGAGNLPRVQTADEIAAELSAAGLNSGVTVRSGTQALLVAKVDANVETVGYFAENVFASPITGSKVVMEYWARPLTSGLGADPSGTPQGNGKTIGERQGNTFSGIADENRVRAAAIRFGVDTVGSNPYENVVARHIDFGSASAGAAVWVRSGVAWEPNQWFRFRFDLDYEAKTYDFLINGLKVNAEPIRFYNEDSVAAARMFVARGTNQAGQIIDDVRIGPVPEPAAAVLAGVGAIAFARWCEKPSQSRSGDSKTRRGVSPRRSSWRTTRPR